MHLWSRLKAVKARLLAPRTLHSIEAYALWAPSYPPYAHNDLMAIEQAAMLKLMPALAGTAVLDLACGTGRYGQIAAQAGAARVTGADNSAPMLRAGANVEVTQPRVLASMIRLPFAPCCFDVVLCGLATGHLPPAEMRTAVAEMGRVLRPGGSALLSDFHPMLYSRGGRRIFRAPDGKAYAVEHYPHALDDYAKAIAAAGMALVAIEEPDATFNGSCVPAVLALLCQRL